MSNNWKTIFGSNFEIVKGSGNAIWNPAEVYF